MHDLNGKTSYFVPLEFFLEPALIAHQYHAHGVFLNGLDHSENLGMWSGVSPHGIYGDLNHNEELGTSPRLLGVFANFEHFTAGVETAFRTGTVRHLRFVTVGALRGGTHMEKVMGAALVTAGFGMTTFWIRHLNSLSLQKC
jgi:hypothetical protein